MAGVLEQVLRPRMQLLRYNIPVSKTDERVLELQVAKEILAEIFGIRTSEVDEMLKQRHEEKMDWPREFCLGD